MPSKKKKTLKMASCDACSFCGTNDSDEVLYGKFYHEQSVSVHQHCLFFASGLKQNGKESDGILGFLIPDINEELCRGRKLGCCYCKQSGATVGCIKSSCRKTFHFPCGVKNQSLHQFFDSFSSYCPAHKPEQNVILTPEDKLFCHICFLSLPETEIKKCLYAPCCKNNWFHRTCLQRYAISAGLHFFKCPLCKNSTDFINEMQIHGIWIPEKDASWELEENAYNELLQRPECSAVNCHCANGRKHNGKSQWNLLSCCDCGSYARHKFCENLKSSDTSWKCKDCKDVETRIQKNRSEDTLKKVKPKKYKNVPIPPQTGQIGCEPSCSTVSYVASLKSITNTCSSALDVTLDSNVATNFLTCPTSTKNLVSKLETKVKKKSAKSLENGKQKLILMPDSDEKNYKSIGDQSSNNILQIPTRSACGTPSKPLDAASKHVDSSVVRNCKRPSKSPMQKNAKRRKIVKSNSACCSGNNQCIYKMFGLECHKFHLIR